MLHSHVWFELKSQVSPERGLTVVREFLREIVAGGSALGFRILKNRGEGERTKLPRYHALVEFQDGAQLGAAMAKVGQKGIQLGFHGEMMRSVTEFRVEVFEEIPPADFQPTLIGGYCCDCS